MAYIIGIFFINRRIFGYHCDGYLMMAAFLLWIPAQGFGMSLDISRETADVESHERSREKWRIIEKDFNLLKKLSDLVNKVFGSVMILFLSDIA